MGKRKINVKYAISVFVGFLMGCSYISIPIFLDKLQEEPIQQRPKPDHIAIAKYNKCDPVQLDFPLEGKYYYYLDCSVTRGK